MTTGIDNSPSRTAVEVRWPPAAEPQVRNRFKQVSGVLLMLAVGGLVGFFGARFGASLVPTTPQPAWMKVAVLVGVIPGWLLVVGWHELGHLFGGWITGGRFLLWVVGPFKIQRTPAGVKAGWNRSMNLGGGLAACLPLEPGQITPRRAAVMILGGPMFSLLLTAALLGLAAATAEAEGPIIRLAHAWLLVTAGLSAIIALATLFPGTAGGFKTDGRRVFDLLRGDRRSDQEAAILALSTATLAGQRPGDFDPQLVARAVALNDGSLFDAYANLTVFAHAADREEWAAAQIHLDRVVAARSLLAPMVRDLLYCEYAWLLAIRTPDAAAARAWLDAAGQLEFDPATRLRAEAALLLAEGKPADAAVKARQGLHALEHKSISPVKSPFAESALRNLLARAESRPTTSLPDPRIA